MENILLAVLRKIVATKVSLVLTDEATKELKDSGRKTPGIDKKIKKRLRMMGDDLTNPSHRSHVFKSEVGPEGEKIWESYVDQSSGWRIFWHHGGSQ